MSTFNSPVSSGPASIPTEAVVITLTKEQAGSKLVEIRSPEGKTIGYLLQDGGMSIYYTPADLAELNRLAASRERGRTLREVLDSVQKRAEG
jgi:hypothetical protein